MKTVFFILAVAVLAILFLAIILMFFGPKKKSTVPEDEEDELVFDEITGKYVTVEELISTHEVTVVTEESAAKVHSDLSPGLQEKLAPLQVYSIMEAYYQSKALHDEKAGPFDQETVAGLIAEKFSLKGIELSSGEVLEIFGRL